MVWGRGSYVELGKCVDAAANKVCELKHSLFKYLRSRINFVLWSSEPNFELMRMRI